MTVKNQFAGPMMASHADYDEDMLKTLPLWLEGAAEDLVGSDLCV